MPDPLKDKVVLITGATGGLGSVVVREFVPTQAQLALTSRSLDKLEELVLGSDLASPRAFYAPADLTQPDEVQDLIDGTVRHFGKVDVLLNTVGGWGGGEPVHETAVQDWHHMLSLNLHSAFLLSRSVLPYMLKGEWGRVVHVGSKTALAPRPKQAGYAVAKMGLIALTESVATEIKGSGVTANVILPSIIDTPANRDMMPKADPAKWVPPERVAGLMRFLCSDAAASINGARIPIYGAL